MPKSSQTKRRFTRKNSAKMSRKYRRKAAMWGGKPDEEAKKNEEIINASENEVFASDKISTQPCNDPEYKEIGIIHMSDSVGLNALRNAATNIFNLVGAKGFDNKIYDKLRNSCLEKLKKTVKENQRVCNLRIEIERDAQLIYLHLYGTLMENKNMAVPLEESSEEKDDAEVVETEAKEDEEEEMKEEEVKEEGPETEEKEEGPDTEEKEEENKSEETTKPV
jgi:hypothetical protein